MQFAAPGNLESILLGGFGDADGDVGFGLAQETFPNDAALHLVAVAASQRTVIDGDGHGDGRRVDGLGGQGLGQDNVAQGVGDGGLRKAGQGHDVAGFGHFDRLTLQAAEGEDLGDAAALDFLAVAGQGLDGHARRQATGFDASGQEASEEGIAFDQNRQHLARLFHTVLSLGRRNVIDDEVVQRGQPLTRAIEFERGPTLLARSIDVREIELFVRGANGGEQVKRVVQHPVRIRVRTVNLVQHQNWTQAKLQSLAQNELGLGHDPFFGVHQEEAAIDHAKDAFHLAAEVGVSGGVDDVDPGFTHLAVPKDRGRLGENGDPALAFLVVGVHGAFHGGLIGPEHARLGEKLIDESGLAMVDVSDDGDIAQ